MIMKLTLTILLTFAFSLQAFASSSSPPTLREAVDEYIYTITVDWDQADPDTRIMAENKFFSSLVTIQMTNGLNTSELVELFSEKISDPQILNALINEAKGIDEGSSPEAVLNLLKSRYRDLSDRGASWNGAAVAFYGGVGLVFIAVLSYNLWFNANHECTEWTSTSRHNVCVNWEKR